jgi:hypothetical protein
MTIVSICAPQCCFITSWISQLCIENRWEPRRRAGLLDRKNYDHLHRILCEGCPNVFNEEATYEQYLEMYKYGNHKSVGKDLDKVMLANNEQRRPQGSCTYFSCLFS